MNTEYVWECEKTKERISKEQLVDQLKKAIEEKDKPGIRLLKGMLTEMGARNEYPEYFL